ncbi:o-succinylbenzoate--CoA ligase [Aquisalibacillus elongatus]|uniref:Fatty-acyl-CoA synthase n=1 Tax=Aquisalibacillus elongatus TaxID=485577 RepID=A0A3N5B0A9_9BACI|nr:o-succinylbenzoate--CoA ligase [Aquisalibacillus elongatus]RPF50599.1 fatty-acyl-CoA synthase [Aquisalibacillus elongatus]
METIDYWIEKRAEITPHREALVHGDKRWSYYELNESIYKMAVHLKDQFNIEAQDRIAILSNNRAEYLMAYMALAKLGAIVVPLNIRLTANELAFQIIDSGSKALIYEGEFSDMKDEIVTLSEIESAYSLDRWEEDETQTLPTNLTPPSDITSQSPFVICYTSGTTGRPKGAVLTHDNMYWNAINNITAIDITSHDRIIVLLPLFHIGGIGLFAFPGIVAGATSVIIGKFDTEQAIRTIEEEKISIVMGVPAIHDAVRKTSSFNTADFLSVRWFYNGGAPCPSDVYNAYLDKGLPFGGGFGMTEASPTIFMLSKEDYIEKRGSIGKPVLYCDAKLIDDSGKEVERGEVGELILKGPNIMKEYWKLPDETENTFKDGWLLTGDLMRQDEDGFFWVAGRKKDMIISGGENIYPLEVEQVIESLPEVDEVAVVGTVDPKWGEVPSAFISFHDGKALTSEEITAFCIQRIGKYKIPKYFYEVDELPRNATGKIAKTLLSPDAYADKLLV